MTIVVLSMRARERRGKEEVPDGEDEGGGNFEIIGVECEERGCVGW